MSASAGVHQPGGRGRGQADLGQQPVGAARGRLELDHGHVALGDQADDVGQEDQRPERGRRRPVAPHEHGQPVPDDEDRDGHDRGVLEREDDRLDEHRVVDEGRVVREPDEVVRADQGPVGQRDIRAEAQRVQREYHDEQQRRGREQQSGPGVSPGLCSTPRPAAGLGFRRRAGCDCGGHLSLISAIAGCRACGRPADRAVSRPPWGVSGGHGAAVGGQLFTESSVLWMPDWPSDIAVFMFPW